MQGWIKLHRKIMESETFSRLNAIQQLIAIYIILNANHEDSVWVDKYKGIEVPVKRGQLVTSRKKIVNEWFKGDKLITEQKVRTAITKLEKLGFLTCKSTNNYTLIEVLNYNVYQSNNEENNQQNNQEITKTQPRDNQGITTNKNEKNEKNDKELIIPYVEIVDYLNRKANKNYRATTKKTKALIKARWNEGFRLEDFKRVIDIKTSQWKGDKKMDQYLRPETLFGPKFEGYLNERERTNSIDSQFANLF